ncbi:DUF4440 domain-containing protein [Hydrogenophaga sp. 5NK40-0174]|uniref:nuclear transport factor 2 family protein n=1 Tax=Hydrogenophaga sp. 5NK40-0174 TaxID=3127649 RepID=UPI00310BBD1C
MTDINNGKASFLPSASASASDSLLDHLSQLECRLHHPGEWLSRDQIDELLHPDFHEVGRSGAPYCRETVIRFLSSLTARPDVVSDAFRLTLIDPSTALLHFRSAERVKEKDSGSSWSRHALRCSLWVREGSAWRLRYHQATPAAEPFMPAASEK